jgi:hypothetical protein
LFRHYCLLVLSDSTKFMPIGIMFAGLMGTEKIHGMWVSLFRHVRRIAVNLAGYGELNQKVRGSVPSGGRHSLISG